MIESRNTDFLSAQFRLTLTMEQAMERAEIHGLRCNLFDVGEDDWFVNDLLNNEGHFIECQHRATASVYTVAKAIEIMQEMVGVTDCRIVLIDDPEMFSNAPNMPVAYIDLATPNSSESASPPRKCVMAEVLHPAIVELARIAPLNRQLHAMILARLGQMPPEGMDTFDKIKDWIETTFDKPAVLPQLPGAGVRQRNVNEAFRMDVTFEQRVTGTCRYSGSESGSAELTITRDDVDEALDGADDICEVVEKLEELVNNEAWNRTEPEMDGSDEGYDYSRHEPNDSDGLEVSFNCTRFRQRIEEYLRQSLSHDELERLGIE